MRIKNLDAKQLVVYRLVEQEGSDGIWKKTLRERSCIARVDFEKIVKGLESKRIIKRFKSVTAKNKIFYILGTLDPDTQHTGGIFFTTSHDLDVEFIEIVSKYCYTYIQQRGSASVSEITMYISTSGIATVQIPREDIQKLLYTLELDAKIESFIPTSIKRDMTPFSLANVDPEIHYRPTRLQIKANGLTNTPCGTCPVSSILFFRLLAKRHDFPKKVIEKCYPGADINPINCIYLEKWLNF